MKYAKIKPEYADKRVLSDIHLVANELYTMNEVGKYAIPCEYYDEVEIPRNRVFVSFGARFESEGRIW